MQKFFIGKQRLGSDWTDVQADLNLTWAHILEDTFSHVFLTSRSYNIVSHQSAAQWGKRTFWHVNWTKTQINTRISAVRAVFVVSMEKLCILGYPKCAHQRFWPNCVNAQADLNLWQPHMSEGTFYYVVTLIYRKKAVGKRSYVI